MGIEERFVIGGEAFVEPDVTPVLAGDEVAKPLVRHLMRNQAFAVADIFGRVGEQGPVGQRRRGGVLHSAFDKIIHADLVVFRPRIRDADFLVEELHDLFRRPK